MKKEKMKRILIKNKRIYNITSLAYLYLKKYSGRRHKVSYGEENPNKIFYLIRPRTNGVEGLMALFLEICKNLAYADKMGYIPYIDMKNYYTQYSNHIDNVWDFYFTQPSSYSEKEVYNSKNVILSGFSFFSSFSTDMFTYKIFEDSDLNRKCYDLIFSKINFTKAVNELVEKEIFNLHLDKSLGVYIRGTDYVKLRPVGEHVQPNIEDLVCKIKEFERKFKFNYIFVVTEDYEIYKRLECEFSDKIKTVSYDSFIKGYNGKSFLSKSDVFKENPYTIGLNYLVKLILLSKCRYFVGSITKGSIATYIFNKNKYEDYYVFNLGIYN